MAMGLELLTVPDCPNASAFEERLAAALAGEPAAVIRRVVVGDEREAQRRACMGLRPCWSTAQIHSPRLANRRACHAGLYQEAAGEAGPVPSVEELRRVLAAAGGH
jgi:hypothetical protein